MSARPRPEVVIGEAGEDQSRARALRVLTRWREQPPDAGPAVMVGPDFPAGYEHMLRALLFLTDLDGARAGGTVIFTERDWAAAGGGHE